MNVDDGWFFPKQEKKKKKKKRHTPGDYKVFVFLCASSGVGGHLVERFNPNKRKKRALLCSYRRKTKQRKNQEHQTRARRTQTERQWDEANEEQRKTKEVFFLNFLNRYKKVDDMKARVEQTRTHKKRNEQMKKNEKKKVFFWFF